MKRNNSQNCSPTYTHIPRIHTKDNTQINVIKNLGQQQWKKKTNGQGWEGHRVHVMQRHWTRTMNKLSLQWVHTVQCPLTVRAEGVSQPVHTVQDTVTDSSTQSRGSQPVKREAGLSISRERVISCCNSTLKSPASLDQVSGPGGN